MAATYVPITPAVLAWAMDQAGVDDRELAERCDTSPDVVAEWREGVRQPTKTQFRGLVSRLRRPSGIYFLPEPPQPDPVLTAFRGPPGAVEERELLDEEVRAIQLAERLQLVTRWVREQTDETPSELPTLGENIGQSARSAAQFLEWTVAHQTGASSASEVARLLRGRLEDAGIIVIQAAMKPAGCRGFSLSDPIAPVIAVNSAYTVEARIFSYLHEFGHLAHRSGHICAREPDSAIERRCEQFAAAFLLPRNDFLSYVDRRFGDAGIASIEDVSSIASHFKVSLRATALRLERLGRATEGLYDRVDSEADFKGGGGFSRDNTAPAIRLREWGAGYARVLLDAEQRGLLGRTDLLEYFSLSNGQLSELRQRIEADSYEE